ncbi:MAG: ABC transporter permease [Armatimonadetes bacterium]|nr:ABC transporter permease [Armatimonadota bacterium]
MMEQVLSHLGHRTIAFLEHVGRMIRLTRDTCYYLGKGAVNYRLTVDQMAQLGVNSLFIVFITVAFAGMVLSLELAHIAIRYGVGKMVGGGVAIAMAREFAPMLPAIVVAGRVGSAITAEIGSMKVTEQIDALEALATSPVRYLVVPRFLACAVMIPILTLFANFSGNWGGYLIATSYAQITPSAYMDSIHRMAVMEDLTAGLIKALVFAILISLVSCHQGMITEGGAAGVGKSTTTSVVVSIILIFATNYFLSYFLFKS